MNLFNEVLGQTYLHNTVLTWIVSLIVMLVVYVTVIYARHLIRISYQRYSQADRPEILKLVLNTFSQTTTFSILASVSFAGAQALEMPHKLQLLINSIFTIVLFWQIGLWSSTAALNWLENRKNVIEVQSRRTVSRLGVVDFILRGVIWIMVLLLMLDNLGVNITSLIAGLGIGGVAVALAVQNVLGDLLASVSITLDKPFMVGEFLTLDDFMGAVEHIGIKSTRLRSLTGEQIVLSNTDLMKSRLRNYGRMLERRILFRLSVTYETPRAKLKQIPALVRSIIEAQADTRFDRCHFANFSASSLDFESVYFVLSADYNHYMDIQQEINFQIHEVFEDNEIKFAYPTQKLFLARTTVQ